MQIEGTHLTQSSTQLSIHKNISFKFNSLVSRHYGGMPLGQHVKPLPLALMTHHYYPILISKRPFYCSTLSNVYYHTLPSSMILEAKEIVLR